MEFYPPLLSGEGSGVSHAGRDWRLAFAPRLCARWTRNLHPAGTGDQRGRKERPEDCGRQPPVRKTGGGHCVAQARISSRGSPQLDGGSGARGARPSPGSNRKGRLTNPKDLKRPPDAFAEIGCVLRLRPSQRFFDGGRSCRFRYPCAATGGTGSESHWPSPAQRAPPPPSPLNTVYKAAGAVPFGGNKLQFESLFG